MSGGRSTDTRLFARVQTMNPGRADEFQRIFFTCHAGHDMGSVPLDMLLDHPIRIESDCLHYEHRRAS